MPYIGHAPTQAGSFILLDDLEGTGTGSFNGSTVTFNLKVGSVSVSPKASSLIVSLDGVIQQSPSSYTTSGSTIVFTEAPAANTEFYGMLMGQSSSVGAGTITLADMAANSVDSDQYVDLSIDNAHVATGLDAVKLADGTVTNAELQYINSLSSNAQTQISAKSPTASPTFTGTVVLPNVPAIVTTQLDLKSPLASPTFTGTPAAPTASATTNTTQLATTAFVRTEVTNLIDSAPSTLDTLNELAAALGDDANFSTTVTNSIATKLPLVGGTMTGAVTGMTGLTGGTGDFNWDSNTLVVDSSESRVGIGTATPGSKLEIAGGADAIARVLGTTTAARLDLQTDSYHKFIQILESDGRFRLYNQTTNREQLTVSSDGNIGIGTSAPASTLPSGFNAGTGGVLEIKSSSTSTDLALLLRRSDAITGLDIWHDSSGAEPSSYFDNRYEESNFYFRSETRGTARTLMTIDGSDGNATFSGQVTAPSLILTPSSAPTATEGAMYYDSTSDKVVVWNGTAWEQVSNLIGFEAKGSGGHITDYSIGSTNYISCCFNWNHASSTERYCFGFVSSISGSRTTQNLATAIDQIASSADSGVHYGSATATFVGRMVGGDVIKCSFNSGAGTDATMRDESHATIIRLRE